MPGKIASMCQLLRLGRAKVKSFLIMLWICCCNNSRQLTTGAVKSLIMRLMLPGTLPEPEASAAARTASLTSSRMAFFSSAVKRGRPLPSLVPSPSPSDSPSPSKCSSRIDSINFLISILSAFLYKSSYTSSALMPLYF